MNLAKKIYAQSNEAVRLKAIESFISPKKSFYRRIIDFLKGSDLDLATFERLEGLSHPRERDAFQQWRDFGGRF